MESTYIFMGDRLEKRLSVEDKIKRNNVEPGCKI